MVTNLYMPFYFRPWIISTMLNETDIADQLIGGIDRIFHFMPKRFRLWFPKKIASLMLHMMDSTDPIPVYRDSPRGLLKTIQLTVDAIECEDNILLFPENPTAKGETGRYLEKGVSVFHTGFCTIAEQYYKRTQKCITFYPMYADKKKRTLSFGAGTKYNPQSAKSMEKQRIVTYLYNWMSKQGEKE